MLDINARFEDKATMAADVRRFLATRIRLDGRTPAIEELEPNEVNVAEVKRWLSMIALIATGTATQYATNPMRDLGLLLEGKLKDYLRLAYEMMALGTLVSTGVPIATSNFSDISPAIRRLVVVHLFAAAHTIVEADMLGSYVIPPSSWYSAT